MTRPIDPMSPNDILNAIEATDTVAIQSLVSTNYDHALRLPNGETPLTAAIKTADQKLGQKYQDYINFDNTELSDGHRQLRDFVPGEINFESRLGSSLKIYGFNIHSVFLHFSYEPMLKKMGIAEQNYPENIISEALIEKTDQIEKTLADSDHAYQNSLAMINLLDHSNPLDDAKGVSAQELKNNFHDAQQYMHDIFQPIDALLNNAQSIKKTAHEKMTATEFMAARVDSKMLTLFPFLKDFKPTPQEFLSLFKTDESNPKSDDAEDDFEPEMSFGKFLSNRDKAVEKKPEEPKKPEENNIDWLHIELNRQHIKSLEKSGYFAWQPDRISQAILVTLKEVKIEILQDLVKEQRVRYRTRDRGIDMDM